MAITPFDWTGKQLALFWLGAGSISVALIGLGAVLSPQPWKFFWLFPYPSDLRMAAGMVWSIVREAFMKRPLEATALILVPIVTIGVTMIWAMRRLWR